MNLRKIAVVSEIVTNLLRLCYIFLAKVDSSTVVLLFDFSDRDEETRKIQRSIQEGMVENAKRLQEYLTTWDNYKEIWEINKDAFIRRYQRLNPPVASFDSDIGRYLL